MTCPRCQTENREGRRFCAKCGAALALACASCGFANEPGDEFCGGCGATLRSAPTPAEPRFTSPEVYTPKHLAEKILTSKAALEGERKQVTVLFADLKGSMELLADRNPEEARKLLDPVLERMMEAVHRYEGTVNQVMGDGIMALFGAPVAHEDHAVRACYAALRMQESVRQYAEGIRRHEGVSIQIRVGLNSGDVVVRSIGSDLRMDYTAVGQTTHLAARMEQLAAPGSIVLAPETLRLAEGYVAAKPLGPIKVKGLGEPVDVYEVTSSGAVRTRLQRSAARGFTPFVGRDAELEQLRGAVERARGGHGQVVAVVGEPGVGKSRLFYEFVHSHRFSRSKGDPPPSGSPGDWLVVESGSVSYGTATPYLPVIDLLKAYFQIDARDDSRKIREKVTGKLLTLDETLRPLLPALLALLDVPVEDRDWQAFDPLQRRRHTHEAIRRLLLRESQRQPLCLVFEDLHWIDAETQAVLDGLVESLPAARLLLLTNYRPEYRHPWGSKTYYSQARIDPLPEASATELLGALLGADASIRPLTPLLIRRTEGNPFFLEESVRTLVETGTLRGERGAYRLARAVSDLQVPATVQSVLAARIDRLPSEDKELLQTAAVVGKDVPLALLEVIADRRDDDLRQGLVSLQASEFLYETRLYPDLEYTFKHALTHEVAYASLLRSTRAHHHQQIARALEAKFPATAENQPELLAHHLTEAGLGAEAVVQWQRAGARARDRSADVEALRSFTRGLDVLQGLPESPERDRQEVNLQLGRGKALILTRGYGAPEVAEAFGRARLLCERVGETPRLIGVHSGLFDFNIVVGRLAAAHATATEGEAVARRIGDSFFVTAFQFSQGITAFLGGEPAMGRRLTEAMVVACDANPAAAARSRLGAGDRKVAALSWLGPMLWVLGYPDAALHAAQSSLRRAGDIKHAFTLAFALYFATWLHQFRRDHRAALETADPLVALAREHQFPFALAAARLWRSWGQARGAGDEASVREMRDGLEAYLATGAGQKHSYFLGLIAGAVADFGDIAAASRVLNEALSLVGPESVRFHEAELHRLRGDLLLTQEAPDESGAEASFRRAIDVARQQQAKSWELRAATSLARLWDRQGRRQDAHRLLADVYAWFTEGFDTPDLRDVHDLLKTLS